MFNPDLLSLSGLDAEGRRDAAQIIERIRDPWWRLTSGRLYKIMVKDDEAGPGENFEPENDEQWWERREDFIIPFLPNDAQLHLFRTLHYRNLILKARQRGFCLDPSTPVLTADLRWVRIEDLSPGDEVMSVDEFPRGGRGTPRKMRVGTVQAVVDVEREAYRIRFDDGRSVVCTAKHPWLSKGGSHRPSTELAWRSIEPRDCDGKKKRLKVGMFVRYVTIPWGDPDYEDGWFGGMLDGEGSIAKSNATPGVSVSQVHGPVWERLVSYAESRGYHPCIEEDTAERPSKFGSRPVPKLAFGRTDEIIRLVGQTRPTRFVSRRFWEGRALPGRRNNGGGLLARIVSIEPLGIRRMIDLQTSEGTYIANGFVSHNTTAVCILFLDHVLFNANQRDGIVAHNDAAAKAIFRDKVKLAYRKLPPFLLEGMPLERNAADELLLAHNNSSIRVSTSMRSGTIHRLHVSEMGKIAAKFPDRATEVKTGSIPAVPLRGVLIVESTGEGPEGAFFEMYQQAAKSRDNQRAGAILTPRDYKLFFSPWWEDEGYVLDPEGVEIGPEERAYIRQTEAIIGRELDKRQWAWYFATRDADYPNNPELMWQEYPSTEEEAFQRSPDRYYFALQLARAKKEGRITRVPHVRNEVVNTFWDIGKNDINAIWYHQQIGIEHRFIGYYENRNEDLSHYVAEMQGRGYIWGTDYLPHDAAHHRLSSNSNKSVEEMLNDLGRTNTVIVPRIENLQVGIQQTRDALGISWIDAVECKTGLKRLAGYCKRWNDAVGAWSDEPAKNDDRNGADAYRQFAQVLATGEFGVVRKTKRRKATSWKVA